MYLAFKAISDTTNAVDQTIRVFALYALHNILSTMAGRAEYFSIVSITEIGEGRNLAIEAFIGGRILVFNK